MDHAGEARSRVGEVVAGKYQLERLLGSGGMGAVYAALHTFTQRRVAVKLMHASIARSKVAAERFLREARAPGSIGHPGIVEVLDGGYDEDGSLYLVMEVLQGETLGAAMRDRRLHLQEIAAIVLELLDILGAAHDAGFVHRDIKPENIFLSLVGEHELDVKLLDFGVAGVIANGGLDGDAKITRAGAVLGTPLYMSPEQALGRKTDSRSDLWSVGALLYQALTGMPPYNGDGFHALVVSISTHEHTPLGVLRPDLPPRLHAVVERALRKDPGKRWSSAREMADALQSAVEGRSTAHTNGTLPIESMPTVSKLEHELAGSLPKPARSAQPDRPSNARIASIGIAAVLAMGALAYALTIGRGAAHRVSRDAARHALHAADEIAARDEPAAADRQAAAAQPEIEAPRVMQPAADRAAPAPAEQTGATRTPDSQPLPQAAPATVAAPAAPRPLSSAALSWVLSAAQDRLQHCYQDAMVAALTHGQPPLSALSLEVSLAIAKQGSVTRAEVTGEAPPALRECIATQVRALTFPVMDADSSVRFPIVFQPEVVGQ